MSLLTPNAPRVPSEVKLLLTIPDPRVVELITSVLLILYVCPELIFKPFEIVPKLVKLEFTIPDPRVVELITSVLLILYVFPLPIFKLPKLLTSPVSLSIVQILETELFCILSVAPESPNLQKGLSEIVPNSTGFARVDVLNCK